MLQRLWCEEPPVKLDEDTESQSTVLRTEIDDNPHDGY